MKTIYEVEDFVSIKMELFDGLSGTITEVKDSIYVVHICASLDHSEFDIYATADELEYIGHYGNKGNLPFEPNDDEILQYTE